jgi:hypothetical protein
MTSAWSPELFERGRTGEGLTKFCRATSNLDQAFIVPTESMFDAAEMSTSPLCPRSGGSSVSSAPSSPAVVTVVTSSGCHLCEEALEELAHRADELTVTVAPADTDRGRELVQGHLPVMFPLVLVDGVFFSTGRLPRRKLDKVLADRARRAVSL